MVGLVALGPGLGGGSLLSLDLLVTPHIPIPNGVYGLGPALSQRVPLFALVGLGSLAVGGPVATKVLLVACVATGFAGAARLARLFAPAPLRVGVVGQVAAGLLWAAGPFALTRISAGHVNLWWVVAVLPWVLARLCRPGDDVASTFLASFAMAVGGPGGGTLGVTVGLVALGVTARRGRVLRPLLAIVVPQALWVLPTAVLLWAGAGVTGAGGFATVTGGSSSWAAIAVGNGFWRWDVQVGAVGGAGSVAGLVVLALAGVGCGRMVRAWGVRSWQGTATVVAAVGLALAVASAVPGVRAVYGWASELPMGAPLRESHRFLAMWLVVAAPAVAVGAAALAARAEASSRSAVARFGRPAALVAPLVVALVVSVPGWWGLGGRLEPVDFPSGWALARAEIHDNPGTAIALPWSEYPPLSFAGGRQVFNPLPEYLGGDVISSYDPVFDPDVPRQEQVDRRAKVVDALSDRALAGEPIAAELGTLGVRWVVVAHEARWEQYRSLSADPGLLRVLALPDLDLYEVATWSGRATGPDGRSHRLDRPVPPVITTDAPPGSVLHVAGAPGWVQGWATPVPVTDDGQLVLEGGPGVVWFWPAAALVVADVALLVGVAVAAGSRRRRFGRILAPRGPRG